MIRYYILPIEAITTPDGQHRGPKYLSWREDPDPPGINARYTMMDYGLIDAGLVCADVTQEQHEALVANDDVASVPENIDQNISEIAIPKVQFVLEVLRIPSNWVNSTYTYRQILRMVAGLFQFAQKYHAMNNEQLITSTSQLDLRWNQIPQAKRDRIIATANTMGYDYSAVQPTWLVRRILKHLADQWGAKQFSFGFTTL